MTRTSAEVHILPGRSAHFTHFALQECTFRPALVSERMGAQGRAMRMAGTLAHYPGPPSEYPDSPESQKYRVSQLDCVIQFAFCYVWQGTECSLPLMSPPPLHPCHQLQHDPVFGFFSLLPDDASALHIILAAEFVGTLLMKRCLSPFVNAKSRPFFC